MSNLTITLDDDIIRSAKLRAVQEGSSLSAQVREYLRRYAEGSDAAANPDLSFIENARQIAATASAAKPAARSAAKKPGPAGKAAATKKSGPIAVDPATLRVTRGWAREDLYPSRRGGGGS